MLLSAQTIVAICNDLKRSEQSKAITNLTLIEHDVAKGFKQELLLVSLGLRSGEITPKSMSTSRPGSDMSTSTTNSGLVIKRTTPVRKARPVSIAVTGVSKDGGKFTN